ncbi:hypothetical protein V5799_014996 [Amblyomma americanum]|uniref:Uncharacterized protein n=1 Tax=Amblyomma americanum TaxID=6943 RepID=A0AAQ4E1E9_AMBAM
MKMTKDRPANPKDLSYGRALSGSQRSQGSALEQHEEEAAIRGGGEERAISLDKRRKINAAEKLERAVADSECTSSDEDEDEEGSASETERRAMEERSVVLKEARARRWNNTKRRRRSEEAEEERAISLDKRRKINAAEKLERAVADSECTSSDEDEEGSASETARRAMEERSVDLKEARARRWNNTEIRRRSEETREERAIRFDNRRKISAAEKLERAVADS